MINPTTRDVGCLSSDKFKIVNYEYNSSSNLHFKQQRNASVLSGVNYPKKNITKGKRDDSCGATSDHLSTNGTDLTYMPQIQTQK